MRILRKTYKSLVLAVVLTALVSCEEVIEIDLNSANPVLTAEGYMDRDSLAWVRLEYTTDYFHAEGAAAETTARVIMEAPDGASEELVHVGEGIYRGSSIRGEQYGAYGLDVEVDGVLYEGTTHMRESPDLLKVEVQEFPFGNPHDSDEFPKLLEMSFGRIAGQDNYLMLKLSLNGESIDDPFALASDEFFDGDTIRYTAFVYPPPVSGDTLELEFFAIDEDAFRYYYQVSEAISGGMGMSTAPYNPASNLGEGILGYFMARTRSDTIIYLP